jgi:elongation factor P
VFMDSSNYEQVTITDAATDNTKDYLLENMNCSVTLWNGDAIAVRLPNTVTLEVVYTEPAIKGDTQSRVLKPAKLNTGGSVNVPIFIDIGEKILVNTQTREYAGRVSK